MSKKQIDDWILSINCGYDNSMLSAIRSVLAKEVLRFNGRIVKGINPEAMYELWGLGWLNDSFSQMLEELAKKYL